jgi:hypothetical protein
MDLEVLAGKADCCTCGRPMAQSKHVNIVTTDYEATWSFPVAGNILTDEHGLAVSIVCDGCVHAPVRRVLEFRNDIEIIYHPVEEIAAAAFERWINGHQAERSPAPAACWDEWLWHWAQRQAQEWADEDELPEWEDGAFCASGECGGCDDDDPCESYKLWLAAWWIARGKALALKAPAAPERSTP